MRIRSISARHERLAPHQAAAGYAGLRDAAYVRCRVETEDGPVGTGVTGRFLGPEVVALLTGAMADELRGADAGETEAIRMRLASRFNPRGMTGAFVSALSALDLALWDLKGKALGQPVWRLLGAARSQVPVYATVGLPAYDEAALIEACRSAIADGYRGAKMLVAAGGRGVVEDARRVRAVREALGPAAPLMLDANCGMTVADAKRLATMVEECDITWFEEPVTGNDIEALAELRRSVRVPIAAGQMVQSMAWFREALVRGAVDWLQPNAVFCGGVSAMLRVLALAEAHGVPVSHAGGWDLANLAVMAGHGHGGPVEMHGAHLELRDRLADQPAAIRGVMAPPERPGIGFAFADDGDG